MHIFDIPLWHQSSPSVELTKLCWHHCTGVYTSALLSGVLQSITGEVPGTVSPWLPGTGVPPPPSPHSLSRRTPHNHDVCTVYHPSSRRPVLLLSADYSSEYWLLYLLTLVIRRQLGQVRSDSRWQFLSETLTLLSQQLHSTRKIKKFYFPVEKYHLEIGIPEFF